MKTKVLIYCILIIYSNSTFSQADLKQTAHWLNNGIMVRPITNDFIESEKQKSPFRKYSKNGKVNIPKSKTNYSYLSFKNLEIDFSPSKDTIYQGYVFMSHSYFEDEFDSLFYSYEAFKENKNGFFMACKLYKNRNGKIKVNIYPDFTNYCDPKKHREIEKIDTCSVFLNDKINYEKKCEDYAQHLQKQKDLMRQRDYEPEDFWNTDKLGALNLDAACKNEINFRKFIKNFQIDFNARDFVTGITLDYTKYSMSSDKSDKERYSFYYRCENAIKTYGSNNAFIGTFKSINRPFPSQMEGVDAPASFEFSGYGADRRIEIINVKEAPFGCEINKEHFLNNIKVKNDSLGWIFAGSFTDFINLEKYFLTTNAVLSNNLFNDFKENIFDGKLIEFKTLKNIFIYPSPPEKANKAYKRTEAQNIILKNKALELLDLEICQDVIGDKLCVWLYVKFKP